MMKVCYMSSECTPFVKTGGLADVSGALPKALADLGCEVKQFLPFYKSIRALEHRLELQPDLKDCAVELGDETLTFSVWKKELSGSTLEIFFIDCAHFFHRDQLYTDDPDEPERFILFQLAVLHTLQKLSWAPDVIHCNDWQTALIPVYLKRNYAWDRLFQNTSCLLTIHNIGYQGRFAREMIAKANLQYDDYFPGGPFELHGTFCFLKAGILHSETISTVSPTYAREIQSPEYGSGLDGVLRARGTDVHGILNGIDLAHWNPSIDAFIPFRYSSDDMAGKARNKRALLKSIGLPWNDHIPVVGIVSRFAAQKGFSLIAPVIDELMQLSLQFVVLGSGDPEMETFFRRASQAFPAKMWTYIGFHNELAHRITAGADMFLMPSLYEPCGLNQMYSLVYGTVPVVRRTGGLADTVQDIGESGEDGNGFVFVDKSPASLAQAVTRAVRTFPDREKWGRIVERGMKADFSWTTSAARYRELYQMTLHR